MASRFFYLKDIKEGDEITLAPDQAHHLVHVLRQKVGNSIELVDGKGRVATGSIKSINGSAVAIRIEKVTNHSANSKITLAFAIPKGPALDFIFRKCTEVGLANFQPLITQHSLAPDRWNSDRWEKIVAETIKQCQSSHAPQILPPLLLSQWLSQRDVKRSLFFCDEQSRDAKPDAIDTSSGIDVLVGAEGGWSKDETAKLSTLRASFLGLGSNRLRAETACLVAVVLSKKAIGEL